MALLARLSVAVALLCVISQMAIIHCAPADFQSYLKASPAKFSKLTSYLTKAKLIGALNSKSVVTVFAPTNAAFSTQVSKHLDALDVAVLADALKFHVAPGIFKADSLKTGLVIKTLSTEHPGQSTLIADSDAEPGSVVVRGLYTAAKVTKANVAVGSSVVHEVDTVLLDRPLANTTKYGDVREALTKLGLKVFLASTASYKRDIDLMDIESILSSNYAPATVFAISDAAFKKWTKGRNCLTTKKLPSDSFTAYSFSFEFLPKARLTSGMLIPTLNFYDEELIVSKPQELEVLYKNGKPQIRAQPWRQATDPFWIANILDSVYAGSAVVHIIDTVLFPLNSSEDDC